MDIDGVGERLLEILIEKEWVTTPADLYRLSADSLQGLDRMGAKSARNVIHSITHQNKQRLLDFYMRLEFAMSVKQRHGLWRPHLVTSAG